jgi:hypothetical protein
MPFSLFQCFNVAFDSGTKTVNDAYRFSLNASEEFTASYVRIIPKSGNTRTCDPAIRVEFEGCIMGVSTINSKASLILHVYYDLDLMS